MVLATRRRQIHIWNRLESPSQPAQLARALKISQLPHIFRQSRWYATLHRNGYYAIDSQREGKEHSRLRQTALAYSEKTIGRQQNAGTIEVAGTGFEANSPTCFPSGTCDKAVPKGVADSYAFPPKTPPADPDLMLIAERWSDLPAAVKVSILSIVRASAGRG